MRDRTRVIVESPFANDGDELNQRYARACMLDSLRRGEAPFLGHLLYTQVLDDRKPLERDAGMRAGWAWMAGAQLVAIYDDLGLSLGVCLGAEMAMRLDIPSETRQLGRADLEAVLGSLPWCST